MLYRKFKGNLATRVTAEGEERGAVENHRIIVTKEAEVGGVHLQAKGVP